MENELSGQLFPFTEKLKFLASDGKMRPTFLIHWVKKPRAFYPSKENYLKALESGQKDILPKNTEPKE